MSTAYYQPGVRIWFTRKGDSDIHEGVVTQVREPRGLVQVQITSSDEPQWFLMRDLSILDYETSEAPQEA